MDQDTTDWLARWSRVAGRAGLTLREDAGGWRLDPASGGDPVDPGTDVSVSEEVRHRPDGHVETRVMTREEVEAFFGPDDGAI